MISFINRISLFSLFALLLVALCITDVEASPKRMDRHIKPRGVKRDFTCDVSNVHCCDQVMSGKDAEKSLGNLLAIPGSLLGQNVGLGCTAVSLLGLGSCGKSTPVCCSKVYQSGLINVGCTPLSII